MKPGQIWILTISLLLAVSCGKKKFPESVVENDPVNYAGITVDGKPVQLKAGYNDYYLYSRLEKDSSALFNFISEFKPLSCVSACPQSLRIQINDFELRLPGQPPRVDSSLRVGPYNYFRSDGTVAYQLSLTGSFNKIVSSSGYKWSFGDDSYIQQSTVNHVFEKPGVYDVCLSVTGQNGCSSSSCRSLRIGNSLMFVNISANTSNDTVIFSAEVTGGQAPYKYSWDFGDGGRSALQNPQHSYNITGGYQVALRVTDATNDTALASYNLVTKKDLSSCAANFRINSISTASSPPRFSGVCVRYTDDAGIEFSSSRLDQPSSSFFEVLSVEEGALNENNQPTKKLRVRFNCRASDGQRQITIAGGEAVIAMPYR